MRMQGDLLPVQSFKPRPRNQGSITKAALKPALVKTVTSARIYPKALLIPKVCSHLDKKLPNETSDTTRLEERRRQTDKNGTFV
jgi:hypothetical protein